MGKTRIEWATDVWNPVTGCTPISEGCQNCYAKCMAQRLKGRFGYDKDDPFRVTFHPDKLDQPLKWRKPRRIFVCSMGDLFHDDVKELDLFRIITAMHGASQHIFMLLTKRPDKMLRYFADFKNNFGDGASRNFYKKDPSRATRNMWLGITAENQERWDERKFYLDIPTAKHFVSLEPLLAPVAISPFHGHFPDWVIVGGETGPGARPMHPEWVRSIRDQCQEAGVPFFFKGWGEWVPSRSHTYKPKKLSNKLIEMETMFSTCTKNKGNIRWHAYPNDCNDDAGEIEVMTKVGKKKSGRLIDGQEWNKVPK